jgi:N-acetylglucosaminyldiphosphoundecaprenol N-acetyl-beta-D-mannosaminyltransferase
MPSNTLGNTALVPPHRGDWKHQRIEILDAPVDLVTPSTALAAVQQMIEEPGAHCIFAVNPEKVIRSQSDLSLRALLAQADLLIPDGIGIVLGARVLHGVSIERVPGIDLFLAVCERASEAGYRLYLLGAEPDVNRQAHDVLKHCYPRLSIVGTHHGLFSEDENPSIIQAINLTRPDIVFVALGSPRQEEWITANLHKLQVKVCQGVGGSFDVLAGRVRRAPLLFRKYHLEWLYRLLAQPSRAKRQLALPIFAYQVLCRRVFW